MKWSGFFSEGRPTPFRIPDKTRDLLSVYPEAMD